MDPENLPAFWGRVYWETSLSLDDTFIYRCQAAHRIVRTIAGIQRRLEPSERLHKAFPTEEDWYDQPDLRSQEGVQGGKRRVGVVPDSLATLIQPLPLLPHHLHNTLKLRATYHRAIQELIPYLQLDQLPSAPLALRCLFSAFPHREDLIRYESLLINDTAALLLRSSVQHTQTQLTHRFGYAPNESLEAIQMASQVIHQTYQQNDIEVDRALMVGRLEYLYQQARKLHDHRLALSTLKQIAEIKGLTTHEIQNMQEEFKKVTHESSTSKQHLPPPKERLIKISQG